MAFILKADGTRVDGSTGQGPGGKLTLKQLQEAVGGYIEAIPGTRARAYFNEEGRPRGLPFNELASAMFGQVVLGDAIVLEEADKQ
jgi:hypothetical protein